MKQDILDWLDSIGPGWNNLLYKTVCELDRIIDEKHYDVDIIQVKEKWGRLVIYLSSYFPELEEIVDKAEKDSAYICERCGEPSDGVHLYKGWYKSLCPHCAMINRMEI